MTSRLRAAIAVVVVAAILPIATGYGGGGARPGDGTVRFVLDATGDVITHDDVLASARAAAGGQGYDFKPLFRALRPTVREAPAAICHQEVVIGPAPVAGFPRFRAPTSLARALRWVGWDACSTASNHAADYGAEGIATTIRALRNAGVGHSGTFGPDGLRRPAIVRVKGVRIALLSYVNGLNSHPGYAPARVNVPDSKRTILAAARTARRNGADAVVVDLHTLGDYQLHTKGRHLRLVRGLTAHRAITAVVGEGPHVVQRIRWLNGKPAVVSTGNLLGSHHPTTNCCGGTPAPESGMIAQLHFEAGPDGVRVQRVSYVPTFIRERGMRVIPVGVGLRRGLASRRRLRNAYRRTVRLAGRSRRVQPIPRQLPG